MTRIAVIGHVEWITHTRTPVFPRAGAIVHLDEAFDEPGGAGGVAARVLAGAGIAVRFYTSLADDDLGRRAAATLTAEGVEVCAAARPGTQNRALTVVDDDRERTILVVARNTHPTIDDPLPWGELSSFDAVFFTGEDPRTLVAARAAGVVVCTARRLPSLVASGVEVDVLVGSANDPAEHVEVDSLPRRPRAVVRTDGGRGGTWMRADGGSGSFAAAPVPGAVVDSFGAGDAFMAGLTLGLGQGEPLPAALALAARFGAEQLTRRGGAPRPT